MSKSNSPHSGADTDEGFQTPPLSKSAPEAPLFTSDEWSSLQQVRTQHPFSPLTLDDLGLIPPATPSALLDVVVSASLADRGENTEAAQADSVAIPEDDAPTTLLGTDDSAQPQDVPDLQASLASSNQRACTDTQPTSSSTEGHESFLTSFLQSLTGGEVVATSQPSASATPSESEMEAKAKSTAWTEFLRSGAITNVGHSSRTNAIQRHHNSTTFTHDGRTGKSVSVGVAGTGTSHGGVRRAPKTGSRRIAQAVNTAIDSESGLWSSKFSSSPQKKSSSDHNDHASTRTSLQQTHPVADRSQVTKPRHLHGEGGDRSLNTTPLQRSESSKSRPWKSASSQHSGADKAKANLSLDLSHLSHFSLPQAIPLQPRPRYPISMVETAALYETDLDTDRESDTSPSGSTSFCVTPNPAVSVSVTAKRKSVDPAQRDDHLRLANGLPIVAVSLDPHVRPVGSTSEQRNGSSSIDSEGPLEKVPLSNVVRSRSWSYASQASSSTQVVPPRSVKPANAGKTDLPKLSRPTIAGDGVTCPSSRSDSPSSARIGSTAASKCDARAFATFVRNGNRSASYDFTRQALLDLVRRTNLGMAQNTPSDSTLAGSLPCRPPSRSKEGSSTAVKPANASPDATVSCHSNVPADLQARLQSWQHHRKRQKLPNEAPNDTSTDTAASRMATNTDPSGLLGSGRHALLAELRVGEQSWSNKVSNAEEQEQKSRKHEHYQRLLNELDAQMQAMRRTEAQKQKDKEASDDQPRAGTSEEGSKKSVEFRKPSPPSKTSGASSLSSLGCNATSLVSDDEEAAPLSLQSSMADAARTGDTTLVTLSLSKDNTPTVTSCAETKATDPDFLTAMSASASSTSSANRFNPAEPAATWIVTAGSTHSGFQSLPSGSDWLPKSSYGFSNWQQNFLPSQPAFEHRSHQNAIALATNWQDCQRALSQPSWLSSSASGSCDQTASPMSMTSAGWTRSANRGVGNTSSSSLAVELMLRHPNWSRDLLPGAWNYTNTMHAPHYVDTSSFAISTAAGAWDRTSSAPRLASGQTDDSIAAIRSSKIKRPFSPGAEVVFWSVKGEHSVKLRGTVESMTERSASIVVVPADDASSMSSGTDGPGSRNSDQALASQMTYSNVPFVNIVARDQAFMLGLL